MCYFVACKLKNEGSSWFRRKEEASAKVVIGFWVDVIAVRN